MALADSSAGRYESAAEYLGLGSGLGLGLGLG